MAKLATGLDVGSRSAIALCGKVQGNSFLLTGFCHALLEDGEDGFAALELPAKRSAVRMGISGREVNVRYLRVPRVPDWQLKRLMRFEVEEIGGQSGAQVASDFNVLPELPEIEGEDVVLLAMARESYLEQQLEGLGRLGARLESFTPASIALYNAWLRFGVIQDDTVLVANIGHESIDVVLARGTDLLFARNMSGGGKLFDDAIAQRLSVNAARAEELKRELVDLDPEARFTNAEAEKVTRACLGPAGQLLSLLQSTVGFCKSQVKLSGLKLDRVVLCGGSAALEGLPRRLQQGLGVPVEIFDPFRVVDTSKLSSQQAEALAQAKLEAVVALGLATMSSDEQAYSIEILPAQLQRRREFVGGTLFLAAAALLALGFLVLSAWRGHQELGSLEAEVSRLKGETNRALGADARTRELEAESVALVAQTRELFELAGSGAQLARVSSALEASLPADFWVTRLQSSWRFDSDLGIERADLAPILRIEGAAREGAESPALVFQGFVQRLEQTLVGARIKQSFAPSGASFSIDLSLLSEPKPTLAPAPEGTR